MPPHSDVARAQAWIDDHRAEILEDLRALLRIPSVEGEPAPNAPFGQANREALDFVLARAKAWDMRTKDVEGYAGWAEWGQGDRLVMALGHLDVVPIGPGWRHEPFGAEVEGGYVYARGAVDDKGPTVAAFYASRALQQCAPHLGARIRLVFGCNEESGFRCIHRYVESEEIPTFGVAPDSGWPLYHAEKGIANLFVVVSPPKGEIELLELTGGQRPNIVVDSCRARVRVAGSARERIEGALRDAWDRNLSWSWEGDELVIESKGKAAHGSAPFFGDSAITRALRLLAEVAPPDQERGFAELLMLTHPGGAGLGIAGSDEPSADLTNNVGVVETTAEGIRFTCNIRYPVTWRGSDLRRRCEAFLGELEISARLDSTSDSPPLYFPLEHPLVETIVDVYAEETGERLKPGTMGGGTYARAIPNTVSIGTGWPGDGRAHENDERLCVEHLYKMARIYTHIVYRLATLPA